MIEEEKIVVELTKQQLEDIVQSLQGYCSEFCEGYYNDCNDNIADECRDCSNVILMKKFRLLL